MQEAEKPQRKNTNWEQRGRTAVSARQHSRATTTTMGHGKHHSSAVVGSAQPRSPASSTPHFVLVLVRVLYLCWVILGLPSYLLRSSRPSKTSSNLVIEACKLEFCKKAQNKQKNA